jgi:histidyl-tRNA synthetase
MGGKVVAPRGTRDILGAEAAAFEKIESTARDLFFYYGYTEIRTPLFESRALFERSVGDDTDIVMKELYAFQDRKGRELALRPEGTAGVVRAFIEQNIGAAGGVTKLHYSGPMFRYERPQGGRYRQFWQLGCEMFGPAGPTGTGIASADIEMIALATRFLERLSIPSTTKLNHLGCASCREAFSAALAAYYRGLSDQICPTCRERLERNPLRILDCKVPECRALAPYAPLLTLCGACSDHLAQVESGLARMRIPFTRNTRLVRGLDYYTGVVFEMCSDRLGAQDAVLGGGRYDRLVEELGGAATPAVGFAAGMDRLAMLMEKPEPGAERGRPFFYIVGLGADAQIEAAVVTQRLRRIYESMTLAMSTRPEWIEQGMRDKSLRAHLKDADRLNAAHVIIIGEDELAAKTVILREMSGGHQSIVRIAGLDDNGLRDAVIKAVAELTEVR